MTTARFLFIDLNAFLSALGEHKAEGESSELSHRPELTDATVDPGKLTLLLEGECAVIACRGGSYMEPFVAEGEALKAAGWDMKKKSDLSHRTLENMLTKAYEVSGPCGSYDRKDLVVATGALTPSMRSSLETFLQGNWRVELHCFQRCWQPELEQMKMAFAPRFQVVSMDEKVLEFVVRRQAQALRSAPVASTPLRNAPTGSWRRPEAEGSWRRPGTPASLSSVQASARGNSVKQSWYASLSSAMAAKDRALAQKHAQLLAALPKNQIPTDQSRVVFMDVDDVTESLFTSQHLYLEFPDATQTRDLRLDFQHLSDHVCGANMSLVKIQLAFFATTHPLLTRLLPRFGWNPMVEGGSCTLMDLKLAIKQFETLDRKTLVVVGSNCHKLKCDSEAFRQLVVDCLQSNWSVEIHSWLHALDQGFIELQRAYPTQLVVCPLDDVVREIVYVVRPMGSPDESTKEEHPTEAMEKLLGSLQRMQRNLQLLHAKNEKR